MDRETEPGYRGSRVVGTNLMDVSREGRQGKHNLDQYIGNGGVL